MLPTVNDLEVTTFAHFRDERGVLVPVDISRAVPFPVVRLFWTFDAPPGTSRGGHAHKACHQYYICASGSLQVEAYDGQTERTIKLAAGGSLHIPPAIFTTERFSVPGSVLIVLCSHYYDLDDYLKNHETLAAFRRESSAVP